jgi:endonuclease-8
VPEGHTVHRLANAFNAQFKGKRVDASSPQGRFAEGAALLDGRTLMSAEAWGKQMFLRFSGGHWLRVHLGLYGMWRFAGEGLEGIGRRRRGAAADGDVFPPAPAGAVRLRLVAGKHVADLSGPTACEVLSTPEKRVAAARLGEDPLRRDADPGKAFSKIAASRTSIALLLMRQDIVAGIGNIYRAELLFRARMEPHRAGREISAEVWRRMWDDLAALLKDGVKTGRIVTTERCDRVRKTGKVTRDDANYVAHRAGRPCHVCGNEVLSEMLGGRVLYWCGVCQV